MATIRCLYILEHLILGPLVELTGVIPLADIDELGHTMHVDTAECRVAKLQLAKLDH